MPRVNLGRDPVKERQEATRRIIRRGMAERGIIRQKEVAQMIGMHPSYFSTKLRASSWSLEEMVKLCKTLRLTTEDSSVILGIKGGR